MKLCSYIAVLLSALLALSGLAGMAAPTDTRYDHQSDRGRLNICQASLLGTAISMWACSPGDPKGFDKLASTIDKHNTRKIKLVPNPHKVRSRSEAISALPRYDQACKKALSATEYLGYRIGVEVGVVYWTSLKYNYNNLRKTSITSPDKKLVISYLDALVADAARLGLSRQRLSQARAFREGALAARTGDELIRACIMIDSWHNMVDLEIRDVGVAKSAK